MTLGDLLVTAVMVVLAGWVIGGGIGHLTNWIDRRLR